MKKKFYFATLVITALSFTGCANDEYVGDQRNPGEQNGAIAFSTKSENTVRAGESPNSADAEKLHNQFWVYGTKTVAGRTSTVFKDYKVTYLSGTTSPSNTKGWEYVDAPNNQTIKYWDYSADHYDFEAYSYTTTNSEGGVKRIAEAPAPEGLAVGEYIVKNLHEEENASLYFADKKTVLKTNENVGDRYKDPVILTFKSVLSKIRVGFYETIPGYWVKIDKFYMPNSSATDFDNDNPVKKFVALCPNKGLSGNDNTFVVSYVDINDGSPAVTPAVTKVYDGDKYKSISDNSSEGYKLDPTLTLGGNFFTPEGEGKKIGETYSEVTWDNVVNNTSKYTYVIPQNADALCDGAAKQVKEMKIKVDYTLTSDKDNSREEIKVTGATAIVPVEYVQWKPNTAYSYVFKISKNTNGTTGGGSGPEGLYPITFDAVVEDMAEYKDHLTTVSELSITATQDGQFLEADKAVFKTGQNIKVKVMYKNSEGAAEDITRLIGSNSNSNGVDKFEAAFVTKYDPDKSLEDNLGDGDNLGDRTMNTITSTTDVITLDPKASGYWIVKVTFRETTNGANRDITKYAVLKVG